MSLGIVALVCGVAVNPPVVADIPDVPVPVEVAPPPRVPLSPVAVSAVKGGRGGFVSIGVSSQLAHGLSRSDYILEASPTRGTGMKTLLHCAAAIALERRSAGERVRVEATVRSVATPIPAWMRARHLAGRRAPGALLGRLLHGRGSSATWPAKR